MHAWPFSVRDSAARHDPMAPANDDLFSPTSLPRPDDHRAQIFELMLAMKRRQTSILMITHDMGVVWELCERVIVMYASRIVEEGPVRALFDHPLHPYTGGLLKSIPSAQQRGRRLDFIPGQVPSPAQYPRGCHFADRCPHAFDRCRVESPPLLAMPGDRRAACFLARPDRIENR